MNIAGNLHSTESIQSAYRFSGSLSSQTKASGSDDALGSQDGDVTRGRGGKGMSLQEAMQIFETSLTQRFQAINETLGTYQTNQASADGKERPLTSAAGTILSFIDNRLKQDIAEGATTEELESRLEAGLKGFEQGFNEAKDILTALGSLNDDVESAIGDTYNQVLKGIEQMRQDYLGTSDSEISAKPSDSSKASDSLRPISIDAFDGPSAAYSQYDYQASRQFEFEVTTQDGDVVTINASSALQYGQSSSRVNDGQSQSASVQRYQQSSQQFSLSVEGNLDSDELAALNELLGDVNTLANDFYAGNLDKAFQQAVDLNYNTEEIVGYSLSLTQVETQRAAVAYGSAIPAAGNSLADSLLPVGEFFNDMVSSLEKAKPFGVEMNLLQQLAEGINQTQQRSPEESTRLTDFLSNVGPALESQPAKAEAAVA